MRRAASLVVCTLTAGTLAGCAPGTDANKDGIADGIRTPDSVSMVAPSTPIGTLSGQVMTTDFKPLDNVQVTVIVGGVADVDGNKYSATTDNDGTWAVKGLPAAANAQVTLAKMGFASARANVMVPGNAGNFPVNNGNGDVGTVLLTELKDTLRLQVVTAGGEPAKSLKCWLEVTPSAVRYQDMSTGYGAPVGIFVGDATTTDNGELAFANVPGLAEMARLDGKFSVTIGSFDVDGDMRADYLGTRREYTARELFYGTADRIITLPTAHASGALKVIASNVDSMVNGVGDPLKSMVKPADHLFFVFDQPVLEQTLGVKVTDESGLVPVMQVMKTLRAPNIVEVTVTPAPESGREYNIALRATSAENGSTFQSAAYFFGGDPVMPKPFAVEKVTYKRPALNMSTQQRLEPGDRVIITFNQPIKLAGGASVEVLIDADLDASGARGNALGEKSPTGTANPNTSGFVLTANEPSAEPMSTFSNLLSGYTTRYEFTYSGVMYVPVATNTQFTVFFSELPSSLYGYRTLWGGGVEADASQVLSNP